MLDEETIAIFRSDPTIQKNIRKVMRRVEKFYGYGESNPRWRDKFKYTTRLSRILRFLTVIEWSEKADQWYYWLADLAERYPTRFPPKAISAWSRACAVDVPEKTHTWVQKIAGTIKTRNVEGMFRAKACYVCGTILQLKGSGKQTRRQYFTKDRQPMFRRPRCIPSSKMTAWQFVMEG